MNTKTEVLVEAPWYRKIWWWIGYHGLYQVDWYLKKRGIDIGGNFHKVIDTLTKTKEKKIGEDSKPVVIVKRGCLVNFDGNKIMNPNTKTEGKKTKLEWKSDLKPFKHGEEGTHIVCKDRLNKHGINSKCCICYPHEGCEL